MRAALGCLFAAAIAIVARGEADFKGRILPRVVCSADATQAYAIYVPLGYAPQKKWPVIFCFDPGARGLTPVERLQAAAEKYGYIVAGSLTSRNGPVAANITAMEAMVNDVAAHLMVDPGRFYAAGLSGGARVATQMALGGLAKGVIACSAGFPDPGEIPRRVPFAFFGTTGTEDFNYSEMKRLDQDLTDRKALHRLVIFNGGHEWASVALLGEAVAWLDLQAMRTGARSRDATAIQTALQARLAAVPAPPGPERWLALRELVADFQGLADMGAPEQQARELGATRAVKDWQKGELALARREDAQREKLADVAADGTPAEQRKLGAGLRQTADAAEDTPERRMARRLIAEFMMTGRDATRVLFEQKDYAAAAGWLELQVVLRPGQPRSWYDLARARAFDGSKPRALEALKQAVAAGFRDASRAETDPAFVKLAGDSDFKELLSAMKAAATSPVCRRNMPRRPTCRASRFATTMCWVSSSR